MDFMPKQAEHGAQLQPSLKNAVLVTELE